MEDSEIQAKAKALGISPELFKQTTDYAPPHNQKETPASDWRGAGEPDPFGDRYKCERAKLSMGNLTDDQIANGIFLFFDVRPPLEEIAAGRASSPMAWMTAGKERIRWLSRKLLETQQELDAANAELAATKKELAESKQVIDFELGSDMPFTGKGERD